MTNVGVKHQKRLAWLQRSINAARLSTNMCINGLTKPKIAMSGMQSASRFAMKTARAAGLPSYWHGAP